MKERIKAVIKKAFPDAKEIAISEPVRISEGWETEIYSFDVNYKSASKRRRERLILRIFPGQGAKRQAAKEFDAIRRLHQAGYPVPYVLHQGGGRGFTIR